MSQMGWQPGIPEHIHNPKLLKPLFSAKRPWLVPLILVLFAAVLLGAFLLISYFTSPHF